MGVTVDELAELASDPDALELLQAIDVALDELINLTLAAGRARDTEDVPTLLDCTNLVSTALEMLDARQAQMVLGVLLRRHADTLLAGTAADEPIPFTLTDTGRAAAEGTEPPC